MSKLELDYLQPQTARNYRYLSIPKELIENPAFSELDYGAIILYAKMLERASLSAQHEDKFTDENGRLFIIYTVEQMEKDIQRSHPTVIKFTKQLAEIGLIEKVRQGQGKPSRIYIKDFNVQKSESLTSDSKKDESPDIKNLSPIELNNKELEDKDLPTYFTEDDVDELQENVRDQIEYPVLCERYAKDLADEIVEIITEALCRDSPKMKIGDMVFPSALVRKRMRSLTSEHVSYALDNLGRAGPVHNPHRYLLALLFNAPASCTAATQAIFNANS